MDSSVLVGVLDLRTTSQEDRWKVTNGDFWCNAIPKDDLAHPQGRKRHLSATPALAEMYLTRSLPILLEGRSAFKFENTTPHVARRIIFASCAHRDGRVAFQRLVGGMCRLLPEVCASRRRVLARCLSRPMSWAPVLTAGDPVTGEMDNG